MLVSALGLFAALFQFLLALGGVLLLFLELLGAFRTLGGIGCALLLRGFQLSVVIGLLFGSGLRVGSALRRCGLALRLIQPLLLLLARKIVAILLLGSFALGPFGVVLGLADGTLLVATGSAVGALGFV